MALQDIVVHRMTLQASAVRVPRSETWLTVYWALYIGKIRMKFDVFDESYIYIYIYVHLIFYVSFEMHCHDFRHANFHLK